MPRPIVVPLVVLALLQAAFAIDVSKTKNIEFEFADEDVVPKTALKSLVPETRGAGFIGDLEVGRRYPDETVFRRVIVFDNPTNVVQRSTLTLNINNGIIHYLSVANDSGSYAVVCDLPSSLGSSRSIINIRVSPNTQSTLSIIVAVH